MHLACLEKFKCCISGIGIATKEKLKLHESDLSILYDKPHLLNEETKLALLASKEALESAKLDYKRSTLSDTTAVIMSTNYGSFKNYEIFYESIKNNNLRPQEFSISLANTAASYISIVFKIKGACIVLPGASISQLFKISKRFIEDNLYKIILCGYTVANSKTLHYQTGNQISGIAIIFVIESIEYSKNRNHIQYIVL